MLRKTWIELRSSLWFVPALLVLVAIALALGLVELDVIFARELRAKSWQPLLNAGAEGARGMLTAIASSMITVAGMAFSITIVSLSLASTQYTPRILRSFMRDRANQFVLGIFVAIFTYCLIVLRTIRGGDEGDSGGFVPLLAVAAGMLLALLSIGCLIFFIHHVAASIQASSILKAITDETTTAIDALFPEEIGKGEDAAAAAATLEGTDWKPITARASGYVQHIDSPGLLRFAKEQEAVLRLHHSPGDFVAAGSPLILASREFNAAARDALRLLFVIGDFRTAEQDAGFGIRQIVDIATKALSPGVNDTSTAVSCLDYLGAILSQLAGRCLATPFRKGEGRLRVIAPTPQFADFVAKSFDEIRLSAEGNVAILLQMLCTLSRVANETPNSARRGVLLLHARLAVELADRSVPAAYDRARISVSIATLRATLRLTEEDFPVLLARKEGEPQGTGPRKPNAPLCTTGVAE